MKKNGKKNGALTAKEIEKIMQSELGPNGKVLLLAVAFSGRLNINPYRAGDAFGLHPYEIHQGLTDLKHRRMVVPGEVRDSVTLAPRTDKND